MLVFSILELGRSPVLHKSVLELGAGKSEVVREAIQVTDGLNAIAVCLFIGALTPLGTGYATKIMKMTR